MRGEGGVGKSKRIEEEVGRRGERRKRERNRKKRKGGGEKN